VQQRSLVTQTMEVLRQRVRAEEWRVGDRLPPEQALAEELGVGRNTVREAVRVLSHSRMLEVRQGDGTYVRLALDPAETLERLHDSGLGEYLELQCMLESEAAAFAARHRTKEDMRELKRLLKKRGEYKASEPFADFVRRDRQFHLCIVRAAHNGALLTMYELFAATVETRLLRELNGAQYTEPGLASHAPIVLAIEERDPAKAAAAARATFDALLKQLARPI
jgi:DNA-binding FadR family transcriptional regulator